MKKLYIILYVMILLAIPVYATRYFSYKFDNDITLICPDCDYWINCETDSMYPTFDCNNTLIVIEPKNKEDIGIGDIIWFKGTEEQLEIYKEDVEYIVHRIIDKDYKNCYITKGDNNQIEDDYTPCFYDIKFKVVGIIYE